MKKIHATLMATASILMTGAFPPAQAAPAGSVKNVVIVHGALADGSGWKGVYDILTKDGYRVSIVQEPLTSIADDVAATQRVLDQQNGPVILVGHSYGGAIITVAGADAKVKSLVYVAAVAPSATITSGRTTSIWRSRNGEQVFASTGSGTRLPGGRHFTMLAM